MHYRSLYTPQFPLIYLTSDSTVRFLCYTDDIAAVKGPLCLSLYFSKVRYVQIQEI